MKSILFSLWMTIVHLDWRDALMEIWRAARGIVRAIIAFHHQPNRNLAASRNAQCPRCPFYDTKWQTCGTPGEVHQRIFATAHTEYFAARKIGCWCWLPLANFDPQKDCYARANDLDVGWPDALRPNTSNT